MRQLLCCAILFSSSQAIGEQIIWDFVLERQSIAGTYTGAFGYKSEAANFPSEGGLGATHYPADFFWMEVDGSRREFNQDIEIRVLNDFVMVGAADLFGVVGTQGSPAENVSFLAIALQTQQSTAPLLDSQSLPLVTSDINAFAPVPVGGSLKVSSSNILGSLSETDLRLLSLAVRPVPEPEFNIFFVFLSLILLRRVKCLRKVR